jgi:hypothetical protein
MESYTKHIDRNRKENGIICKKHTSRSRIKNGIELKKHIEKSKTKNKIRCKRDNINIKGCIKKIEKHELKGIS